MSFSIARRLWTRQPRPEILQADFTGPFSAGLWALVASDADDSYDLMRGRSATVSSRSVRTPRSLGGRYGDYVTARYSSGAPNISAAGIRTVTASTSFTLMALLTGSGKTAVTTRLMATSSIAGFTTPGILEGDGTSAVWGARFRSAAAANIDCFSTVPSADDRVTRLVVARYRNGNGLSLFVDGNLVASVANAANLSGVPGFLQSHVSVTGSDITPLSAAWQYAMSDAMIEALTENPWQIVRPVNTPVFYSLSGGPSNFVGSNATSDTAASGGTVSQTHLVSGEAATSSTTADTGTVSQTHVVTGAAATSSTSADTGTVSQTHVVTGSAAQSLTSASAGTISSVGSWTGAPATSATSASTPSILQDHHLTASDAVSSGLLTTAEIAQTHVVTASPATSATSASNGSITLPGPGTWNGAAATSATAASSATISQTHVVHGGGAVSATSLSNATIGDGGPGAALGTIVPVWFRPRKSVSVRFRQ
jgi:hypothetical protein